MSFCLELSPPSFSREHLIISTEIFLATSYHWGGMRVLSSSSSSSSRSAFAATSSLFTINLDAALSNTFCPRKFLICFRDSMRPVALMLSSSAAAFLGPRPDTYCRVWAFHGAWIKRLTSTPTWFTTVMRHCSKHCTCSSLPKNCCTSCTFRPRISCSWLLEKREHTIGSGSINDLASATHSLLFCGRSASSVTAADELAQSRAIVCDAYITWISPLSTPPFI
mmetsp:Transcript_15379/g.39145  ORF Transcript_15379/g.39145 Transcript_15379/m.39145 type:complete len:223 (+) Transcript_15379:430-1098(+)